MITEPIGWLLSITVGPFLPGEGIIKLKKLKALPFLAKLPCCARTQGRNTEGRIPCKMECVCFRRSSVSGFSRPTNTVTSQMYVLYDFMPCPHDFVLQWRFTKV